ncbi:hypothetical protein QJS04_geneDACA019257 [Acorus gramineus]|uniref:Uncharacterized protein n=1 Tax=Acorus gramineus TaxID=55184 RepID=A0AAV9A3C2_ACOGR|nr:hypothetical protein QJS04_geneDACA019257 [Acorus gramineus]
MLKHLMEDKQLDFNAPLLSVRRFASSSSSTSATAGTNTTTVTSSSSKGDHERGRAGEKLWNKPSLPSYKSDLKSGPVRNPGAIPFFWEQTPGLPKDHAANPKPLHRPPPPPPPLNDWTPMVPPPGRAPEPPKPPPMDLDKAVPLTAKREENKELDRKSSGSAKRTDDDDDEDNDAFSDALDTLSRSESFFMNCSVSGVSFFDAAGGPKHPDLQARDFMMGRFLPAAQAMASEVPQPALKRPPRDPSVVADTLGRRDVYRPLRVPLNLPYYQHHTQYGQGGEKDSYETEDGYDEEENYTRKACGLFPRFCLNPIPGMRFGSRVPPPPSRILRHAPTQIVGEQYRESPVKADEDGGHSWEAVYKHKLVLRANQWSDSPTADESSSQNQRSTSGGGGSGGISPYRNDVPQSPFHEGKGFLGVPKKGSDLNMVEGFWEITPQGGSCLNSHAVERTVCVDSPHLPETPDSKMSSVDMRAWTSSMERAEDSIDLGARLDGLKVDEKLNGLDRGDDLLLSPTEAANEVVDSVDPPPLAKGDRKHDETGSFQPPVPPPLPKSPSESWLWRTLPSVSSKNHPQSFLGLQVHHRKRVKGLATDTKWETVVKTSNVNHDHLRFSEELKNPSKQLTET